MIRIQRDNFLQRSEQKIELETEYLVGIEVFVPRAKPRMGEGVPADGGDGALPFL
jgi:hypothetical protein